MAYKFQLGAATMSGSLKQEGSVDIADSGVLQIGSSTLADASKNITAADLSGSGDLKVGGTVRLDGVADAAADLAADSFFFLDGDNLMKRETMADYASSIAGDALAAASGVLAVAVDDSSIEVDSDALRIKAAGVTNAMLSGGIASSKIAELNAFDTDDLSEGASNYYYTHARARNAVSAEPGEFLAYDSATGVFSIQDAGLTGSARSVISVSDTGGDGSLAYDDTTGVITYTGPSASEVRAHLSAESGEFLSYNSGTGQFSIVDAAFSGSARTAISVTDAGGDGSLAYDSGTGVITYTGPSASEVRAHLSAGEMLQYSGGQFSIADAQFSGSWNDVLATKNTDDLAEGSNLYFTNERVDDRVAVLVVGGDAVSSTYDDAAGSLTLAAQVDDSSIEISSDALRVKAAGITNDMLSGSIANAKLTNSSLTVSAGNGLSGGGAVSLGASVEVALDLSELSEVQIAAGDYFSFQDVTDGSSKKDTVDDLAALFAGNGLAATSAVIRLDLNELSDAAISVANDSIAFVDADDNVSKRESIADLVSAIAGGGLTATNGVLSVQGNDVTAAGDSDVTLAEGMNYGSAQLTADRTWTLPGAPSVGDVVHVKAPGNLGGFNVIISKAGSHTIDGADTIRLESADAAVSLMYVAANLWKVF